MTELYKLTGKLSLSLFDVEFFGKLSGSLVRFVALNIAPSNFPCNAQTPSNKFADTNAEHRIKFYFLQLL